MTIVEREKLVRLNSKAVDVREYFIHGLPATVKENAAYENAFERIESVIRMIDSLLGRR